ncbi:MAG: AAA family ATPase [Candidatus Cloacimonadota bacterium]|nr:MAG: AAA family ATPase [Candidatus Cloacimonadota bacterium]PIE77681.1 MAG: AAA family ATPase [Candidatus Delongbacteria bacterium]
MKKIKICCNNNNKCYQLPIGTRVDELLKIIEPDNNKNYVGVRINNKIKELNYNLFKPKHIEFIGVDDPDGHRMYVRSLTFLLQKSIGNVYPGSKLIVKHSVSNGLYCEYIMKNGDSLDVEKIKDDMKKLVSLELPFIRETIPTVDAIKIFEEYGAKDKSELFRSRTTLYSSVYYLDGTPGYYYGHLVPDTSYLNLFDLKFYQEGILLMVTSVDNPNKIRPFVNQDKMFSIFKAHKRTAEILNVENVGLLNKAIRKGSFDEIIKLSEALHEKNISDIAKQIVESKDCHLVLISGPSSSGKTTFSKRLSIHLKLLGLKPIQISLDDYFVDRSKTPIDEDGEYDFESIDAIDVPLFNKDLNMIMNNQEIEVPSFNFAKGTREYRGSVLKPEKNNIFIVEGIHGLNPELSKNIESSKKFKIYISAFTQLSIDDHNRIPTTDNRLLRRIVRDNNFRNNSALETLKRWPSVRRGEEKNIFPYQEEADAMFNSSLLYELVILKNHAKPLLEQIPEKEREFAEAVRLLKFLSYFSYYDSDKIPPTSIIKEFLGGSSFTY